MSEVGEGERACAERGRHDYRPVPGFQTIAAMCHTCGDILWKPGEPRSGRRPVR